jgi:hypothetical protein
MPRPQLLLSKQQILAIWFAYLVGAVFFIYFAEHIERQQRSWLDWRDLAIVGLAVYSLWGCYWFRRKWPNRVRKTVNNDPLARTRRWGTVQIVSFASAESIVLWGVIGKFGASSPSWLCYSLYATGLALLVVFKPTNPPASITQP